MSSFCTDFVFIDILDYKFWSGAYICLWYMLFERKIFIFSKAVVGNLLWWEFILMATTGAWFVFLFPWDDPNGYVRTVTQQLPLRTLVGLIRFIEIYFSFYCFFFFFKNGFISIQFLLKSIFFIALISLVIGEIDNVFLAGEIRLFLIPTHYALNRFTGLFGEPREIGQYFTFFIFIFMVFGIESKKIFLRNISVIGILICVLGIALSISSTALGFLAISIFAFAIRKNFSLKYLFPLVLIYAIGWVLLSDSEEFIEHQKTRIESVSLQRQEAKIEGVPDFINSFEVFDKSALAFLYFNPKYLIFGVGPNTISIPASYYITQEEVATYGGTVNSAPFFLIVNVLSRSGIVGLCIFIYGYSYMQNKLKFFSDSVLSDFFFLLSFYTLLYGSLFFYALLGIVAGLYQYHYDKKINKLQYS